MELDVCIISTVRPEILKLTLDSFRKRFFNLLRKGFPGIKIRGIINIDPAGEPGITPQEMIKNLNLSSYFDIYVLNFPQSPSFPKAVSWCWDQVRTPIFLHLEDDWFLKKTIDFKSDVLDSFDQADNQNKSLVGILCNPSGNKKYPLSSLCLRPSFFRLELIKEIFRSSDNPDILSMSISQDPEKNFKTVMHKHSPQFQAAIKFDWLGGERDGYYVAHLGAVWNNALGFKKWSSTLIKNKTPQEITWSRNSKSPMVSFFHLIKLKIKLFYYRLHLYFFN